MEKVTEEMSPSKNAIFSQVLKNRTDFKEQLFAGRGFCSKWKI